MRKTSFFKVKISNSYMKKKEKISPKLNKSYVFGTSKSVNLFWRLVPTFLKPLCITSNIVLLNFQQFIFSDRY